MQQQMDLQEEMLDLAEPYEEVKDVIPSQDITGQDEA